MREEYEARVAAACRDGKRPRSTPILTLSEQPQSPRARVAAREEVRAGDFLAIGPDGLATSDVTDPLEATGTALDRIGETYGQTRRIRVRAAIGEKDSIKIETDDNFRQRILRLQQEFGGPGCRCFNGQGVCPFHPIPACTCPTFPCAAHDTR